jgi:hypothetical protein
VDCQGGSAGACDCPPADGSFVRAIWRMKPVSGVADLFETNEKTLSLFLRNAQ